MFFYLYHSRQHALHELAFVHGHSSCAVGVMLVENLIDIGELDAQYTKGRERDVELIGSLQKHSAIC
tara:strand:- start:2603 stop:2803 length:201 start_codon:yes stop_codon:yes gene_type:complete